MKKLDGINLMALYAKGSSNGWNDMLRDHVKRLDINGLANIRYRIQVGMEDVSKKKLNSEEIVVWFIRLNRSLELTARQILRIKYPLPNDNTVANKNDLTKLTQAQKKRRDAELAEFFRKSSY